jgi:hypothetical protein
MGLTLFNPQEIVPAFDRYLSSHGLTFSAIAIGGAALSVLGVISRYTRDLDLLETEIPDAIRLAAVDFARQHNLAENWLNTGPSSLARDLPRGWRARVQVLFSGASLNLSTLSRIDLIRSKLWAMCDRMRDIDDLVALAPTEKELAKAAAWVIPLDTNPNWPAHVTANVLALKGRLGRG